MFLFVCFVCFFFYIQAIAGYSFRKTEPPPGFAVGMLGSPKTEFQGKPYGLHSLLSRNYKSCFFFLFVSKSLPMIHAFK